MRVVFPVVISHADILNPGEPNPVLWVDMGGDQVAKCSAWDVWATAVALEHKCVQDGKVGLGYGLGESVPGKA